MKLDYIIFIGTFMKKLTTSILLALFSATIFTPTYVEASWLSKTWKKIEKSWNESGTNSDSSRQDSTASSEIHLPQRSDYPSGYSYGYKKDMGLEDVEFTVLGVPFGATMGDIKRSLGTPTYEGTNLRYGGVTFYNGAIKGNIRDRDYVRYISITNRDTTTYRGIAVGDSLEQVYKVYGKPTYIFDDNAWFYGRFVWGGDNLFGIKFINDGTKVTEIFIG